MRIAIGILAVWLTSACVAAPDDVAPVSGESAVVAGDTTLSLRLGDAIVELALPSGALPDGTRVSIVPWTDPPGAGSPLIVDGLAFRLLPDGARLAHPGRVTVRGAPANGDLPALLWWNPARHAYEPQPIVDRTPAATTYALEHFSDYTAGVLFFISVKSLALTSPLGASTQTWQAKAEVLPWAGFLGAQLYASWDGQDIPMLKANAAPLFFPGPVQSADLDITVPSAGAPGLHTLAITADVSYISVDTPGQPLGKQVGVVMWEQSVVVPQPAVPDTVSERLASHLLHRFAPILWFDNEETSYPRSIEDLLAIGGPATVTLPWGYSVGLPAIPAAPPAAAAAKVAEARGLLARLGHKGAVVRFNPQKGGLTGPDKALADPSLGTVYAHALELPGSRYGLLYTMLFPSGRELGLGPPSATGHQGSWWGGLNGAMKTVLVTVKDAPPDVAAATGDTHVIESVVYEDHIAGHTVEYLGSAFEPLFATTSWPSGRSKALPEFALSCRKDKPVELYPGQPGCDCLQGSQGGCAATLDCLKIGTSAPEDHPWVFVAAKSHALYPRPGRYALTPPASGFPGLVKPEEDAGGSTRVWQPPKFRDACPGSDSYRLEIIPSLYDLTSNHALGHLLFSGLWGLGRFATSRFAPFHPAWYEPASWEASAPSGMFFVNESQHGHLGTSCYRCLANVKATTGGISGSADCVATPFSCQCSACGPLLAPVNVQFDSGAACNVVEPCPPQAWNTDPADVTKWCSRTGLDYTFAMPISTESCSGILSQAGADCTSQPELCGPCTLCNGSLKPSKPETPWKTLTELVIYDAPYCSSSTSESCMVFTTVTGVPGCHRLSSATPAAQCVGYGL